MTDELTAALQAVGPRLRALRKQRDRTLSDVAHATGISISTLSRLESGQRRPTLELLLPLARAYRVPLDELVGSPPTGDPRIHPRPFTRDRMTFVPLTRESRGLLAYKQIIPPPTGEQDPELQVHRGYEWLYVLSGRLRLVLGDRELLLAVGEAAEFDTHIPHAITNPGPGPLELLNLFGREGERMHVRARPASR